MQRRIFPQAEPNVIAVNASMKPRSEGEIMAQCEAVKEIIIIVIKIKIKINLK